MRQDSDEQSEASTKSEREEKREHKALDKLKVIVKRRRSKSTPRERWETKKPGNDSEMEEEETLEPSDGGREAEGARGETDIDEAARFSALRLEEECQNHGEAGEPGSAEQPIQIDSDDEIREPERREESSKGSPTYSAEESQEEDEESEAYAFGPEDIETSEGSTGSSEDTEHDEERSDGTECAGKHSLTLGDQSPQRTNLGEKNGRTKIGSRGENYRDSESSDDNGPSEDEKQQRAERQRKRSDGQRRKR